MALRKSLEPLKKVTINLNAEDYEWFAELFATVGPAKGIRAVMRNYRERYEARMAQDAHNLPELDLTEEELANVGAE